MPSCVIKGCFNTWKLKESQVILHVFPKDKDGIRLWLNQSPQHFPNVEELVEKIYAQNKYGTVRLCSKHFSDEQYFHEGSKRRLRPNALPTIFTTESLSEKTAKKGTKRRKKAASPDPSNSNEMDEGASSSVLFYPQTSDASNTIIQQIIPSHLQIVLPSTSLLTLDKPKMIDKAVDTDMFITKKCQAVGTYPMLGKRNFATQTKPWKGKSQGVLCTILMPDLPKSNQGIFQPKVWQTEKILPTYVGTTKTSPIFPNEKKSNLIRQFDHNNGSPSTIPMVTYAPEEKIKVERMSPPIGIMQRDCGHSLKSSRDGPLISDSTENVTDLKLDNSLCFVKKEDPDNEDSETESSTDDSEKDDLSTKNTSDNFEENDNDPANEATFIVLKSCLFDLIKLIRCQYRNTCHAPLTNVQVRTLGSVIAIDVLCCQGHNSTLWHSKPIKNKMAVGSPLLSSRGPSQQLESLETETFFHNFENYDDLPN
ncbi:uncharacterized protein [Eleutherodactylus coqui]|uniref:THAP-type domain-containing protein n=1 Tax=Eleutherodactylus coqui TaxID=57060 RepID=A0A8J6K946_ELECQ|nr:hypothetical protein GDO78_009998 [Eleutherodactylus coqui]